MCQFTNIIFNILRLYYIIIVRGRLNTDEHAVKGVKRWGESSRREGESAGTAARRWYGARDQSASVHRIAWSRFRGGMIVVVGGKNAGSIIK